MDSSLCKNIGNTWMEINSQTKGMTFLVHFFLKIFLLSFYEKGEEYALKNLSYEIIYLLLIFFVNYSVSDSMDRHREWVIDLVVYILKGFGSRIWWGIGEAMWEIDESIFNKSWIGTRLPPEIFWWGGNGCLPKGKLLPKVPTTWPHSGPLLALGPRRHDPPPPRRGRLRPPSPSRW